MFSSFSFSNLSSVVVFLLVTIPALYKLIKPLIEAKVTTEKNAHIKQHMETGLKIANAVVPEMAVMAGLSNADRKKEAIRFVNAQLQAKGINLDASLIEGLVEQAYQYYKHTLKGDVHKVVPVTEETPTAPVGTVAAPVEPATSVQSTPATAHPAPSTDTSVQDDGAQEIANLNK